ncbi:MAG: hypothetical protein JNM28_12665 [Armatimonadetes bacterium]|nr:hypothetical protein [Armatimonadota bacterium]
MSNLNVRSVLATFGELIQKIGHIVDVTTDAMIDFKFMMWRILPIAECGLRASGATFSVKKSTLANINE